ncbi:hypothetical protein ACLBWT_14345 [Paenibacillus sp. D51F]
MASKALEVLIAIILGFFTGILLSGNGIHVRESGIHILLGCIFWMLTFSYIKRRP